MAATDPLTADLEEIVAAWGPDGGGRATLDALPAHPTDGGDAERNGQPLLR